VLGHILEFLDIESKWQDCHDNQREYYIWVPWTLELTQRKPKNNLMQFEPNSKVGLIKIWHEFTTNQIFLGYSRYSLFLSTTFHWNWNGNWKVLISNLGNDFVQLWRQAHDLDMICSSNLCDEWSPTFLM